MLIYTDLCYFNDDDPC